MTRIRLFQYSWLLGLTLLCCLPGQAATVYKTVDDNGVVSFSDTRPPDNTPVETVEIDAQAPQDSALAQQRLQDMRETTDRMATDRMAREKHRAELRKLQAQTPPRQPAYQTYDDPLYTGYSSSGYSRYYNYPARRPWRPGYRPRPEQPIARPPLRRPGRSWGQDYHTQFRRSFPGNKYPPPGIQRSHHSTVRAATRH